jgi:UDP-2,3-diacylglucosamine pyrophosphatase LpxH
MKKETSYLLVLSDLHFGDTRCSLHSMRVAEALASKLKEFKPLHEIILLGDILDLQLANWAQAIEGMILPGGRRVAGFRYFLNFLLRETGARKVVYIPGNHDYRIFDYHSIEKNLIQPLRTGRKLGGRISFFRSFSESFLQGIIHIPDVQLRVLYPHLSLKINRARLILTHGHFFDPTQAFNHEIGKLFARAAKHDKNQLLKIRHTYMRRVSFYQGLASMVMTRRDLRSVFNALYQPFTALQEKIGHRMRKSFLTPAMKNSIENYVAFCCRTRNVDGLIFGHTHRAGHAMIKNCTPHYIWNTGAFLRESKKSPHGSFITICNDGRSPLTEAVRVHHIVL